MQRTKSKILSILLSLVMLLSLLPTTALAAGNYPDSVRVYNKNKKLISLNDGECLTANDATEAIGYTSGAYVARYDSGTLYLKDYHGVAADGQIYADGDLKIEVEGDSSFTTSLSSATNHLYGIQANGTLTISGSGTLTVRATGKGNVYGIYAKEGVTISAPLAVTVGKNSTTETGSVYGIYTESGAISLSGAEDKTITATGGIDAAYGVYNEAQTSSSAASSSNITISGKLTVNLSDCSYNRGISSQGGDITLNGATVKISGNYYYGIFNKDGNVVIKSCPDVELTSTTSGGEGICTYDGGDLTIENSTVKVSAEGYAANLKGNVSIKDSMVDLTRTSSYYEVIKTGNSSAENTINLSTEGSVTLTASGEQTNNAMITGKVTLVGSTKCEMGTINGSSYDGVYDSSSKTVLKFVHEGPATGAATLTGLLIPTLTVAVPTAKPGETVTKDTPIVVLGVYDDPNIYNHTVAATLEIVGTAPTGVTLEGNTLKVTNEASAGKVRVLATFEGKHDNKEITITKADSKETAIVATAPAGGTNITIPTGSTTTSGNCSYKVYDQYGAAMTGISATWKMKLDPATVTGVTLTTDGAIAVTNTATTCTATVYAEGSGVKSNEITFNIAREESKPYLVTITGADSMNVPIVHAPGADGWDHKTYTAEVKDQYNNVISNPSVEWSVTGAADVSIDDNGKLTVSNKANAGTVTITAKSGDASGTKNVTINKAAPKETFVKITAQDNEPPVTTIICTGSQRTESYTATVYDQYGKEIQDDVNWSLDPTTYSGVSYEISAANGNIVTLKVAPNADEGTFKLVATSKTATTVKGELEITVQKKTDVSSKINFNDGSLTYNGAGQEYKTAALDSSVTPGTGGAWTYTYTAGTGTLDTATGLPKTVGTYTVTATYEDSSNIGSKSATLTITPKTVDIPAEDKTVYIYDGTEKTYNIPTSTDYTVSGNKQTNAKEAGYIVTVKLNDEINTIWADNTPGQKIFMFKIMRATPTGEPTYTKITTSGKTLKDANLTKDTIAPAGTIKWVAEDGTDLAKDTAVEANKLYKWVFTPSDTANYKPLTGTIKLWSKSTSSGGYYYAPTVPDMPMLYRGCTGDAVKTLQDKLNALGYNSGSVDGIFGAKTYAAVTAFQKANSLGVDGIVGKLTWGKIYGVSPAMPVETTTVVGRPMVSYGSRGDAVRKLQELLNALGYDCGSVDGIFGSKTKAAVLAFQKANGLGVDGIVGPLTWAKLG